MASERAIGICILLACLASSGLVEAYEMNMTEYFKMPGLYDFDDYDRCLQETTNFSAYCFVRAEVQRPEPPTDNWRIIEEITSSTKHHLDHRHLYFGMCVNWCAQVLSSLDRSDTDDLYEGLLTNHSKVNVYVNLLSMETANRDRYNRLLNQCVNLRLLEKHQLRATSMVEYCDTNRPEPIVEDSWNFTFHMCLGILITLITLSSFYDLFLKHQRNDKMLTDRDHYKAAPSRIGDRIAVIFSVARNWYRLNQEPHGKMGRDLRFLDCFKFFSMFLVIFAHTNWVIYESAITNPQDPERMLHTAVGTLLVSGSLITVTFFVISGFLLTLNWLAVLKVKTEFKASEYLGVFFGFNAVRYIRLTIPYAFVLLISGVYFDNPGGPLWRHIVEKEQLSCRKNWWANLLYINNYVNNDERCMLQSWYLAADTHSFVVSLVLLMVAHKWPKIRNYLFGGVIAISHIIPAFVTYVNNFPAFFVPAPQTQRDSFIGDKAFTHVYAPAHMNFGCYFFGVIAALVYDEMTKRKFNLRNYKVFHFVWYALIPIGVLAMFLPHPMLQHYYKSQPVIWNSLFAAVQRNSWGFGISVVILGMAAKVGWVMRKFTCLPIFRVLGRLTYGVFAVHLLVIRFVLGTIRQPIYFGTGMMFSYIIYAMTLSYLCSLLLAILVELPVSATLKLLRS